MFSGFKQIEKDLRLSEKLLREYLLAEGGSADILIGLARKDLAPEARVENNRDAVEAVGLLEASLNVKADLMNKIGMGKHIPGRWLADQYARWWKANPAVQTSKHVHNVPIFFKAVSGGTESEGKNLINDAIYSFMNIKLEDMKVKAGKAIRSKDAPAEVLDIMQYRLHTGGPADISKDFFKCFLETDGAPKYVEVLSVYNERPGLSTGSAHVPSNEISYDLIYGNPASERGWMAIRPRNHATAKWFGRNRYCVGYFDTRQHWDSFTSAKKKIFMIANRVSKLGSKPTPEELSADLALRRSSPHGEGGSFYIAAAIAPDGEIAEITNWENKGGRLVIQLPEEDLRMILTAPKELLENFAKASKVDLRFDIVAADYKLLPDKPWEEKNVIRFLKETKAGSGKLWAIPVSNQLKIYDFIWGRPESKSRTDMLDLLYNHGLFYEKISRWPEFKKMGVDSLLVVYQQEGIDPFAFNSHLFKVAILEFIRKRGDVAELDKVTAVYPDSAKAMGDTFLEMSAREGRRDFFELVVKATYDADPPILTLSPEEGTVVQPEIFGVGFKEFSQWRNNRRVVEYFRTWISDAFGYAPAVERTGAALVNALELTDDLGQWVYVSNPDIAKKFKRLSAADRLRVQEAGKASKLPGAEEALKAMEGADTFKRMMPALDCGLRVAGEGRLTDLKELMDGDEADFKDLDVVKMIIRAVALYGDREMKDFLLKSPLVVGLEDRTLAGHVRTALKDDR